MGFILYGGLEPIWSRVFLDFISIFLLGASIATKPNDDDVNTVNINTVMLLIPVVLTWFTAGWTNRWTLSFPMVPLLFLQGLRRCMLFQKGSWAAIGVAILSTLLLLMAMALCLAFPAMTLPPIVDGRYKVGIVDLHLPVHTSDSRIVHGSRLVATTVVARILYPTLEVGTIPYLKKDIAGEFLRQSIRTAAPPPIRDMHWFLDNWNLITLDSKRNAKVLPACDNNNNNNNNKKFPLIVFSHGLGGTGGLYSYQTRSFAAQGYVVVALDHTDGSAPVVQKLDGTILTLDNEANELWNSQNPLESVLVRRRQTEWRAMELEATALALKGLNQKNIPELESLGISFVDRLDVSRLVAMGHSFGGATALTLGFRRPDLIHAVIAHEPAIDWTPNDIRRLVFPKEAVVEYEPPYNGGTGGLGTEERVSTTNVTTYQDMPVLVLSSQEWWDRDGMGMCHLFSHMHKVGSMGRYGDFAVIRDAFHNEFSDMCLLTPLWLARALQVTGSRDPKETAQEIVHRSLAFLESIKGHTPTIIKTGPTMTSDHDEL